MPVPGKIVTAVICFILMIPTMMIVWVKDLRNNPQYCKVCHNQTYYNTWSDDSSEALSKKHARRGISCQTCHDRTVTESLDELGTHIIGAYSLPLKQRQYSMEALCFKCHENYDKVVPLTTTERLGSERNPHAGHWGLLECNECHKMHRTSKDYCFSCHNAVAKEPGWDSTTPIK